MPMEFNANETVLWENYENSTFWIRFDHQNDVVYAYRIYKPALVSDHLSPIHGIEISYSSNGIKIKKIRGGLHSSVTSAVLRDYLSYLETPSLNFEKPFETEHSFRAYEEFYENSEPKEAEQSASRKRVIRIRRTLVEKISHKQNTRRNSDA